MCLIDKEVYGNGMVMFKKGVYKGWLSLVNLGIPLDTISPF